MGNRGYGDGSYENQVVGLLGEMVMHHHLFGNYPILCDGFDGGFDMMLNGYRIDVKTMGRRTYVCPNYVNNFFAVQRHYISDILIFCSYHTLDRILEVCGWVTKVNFFDLASYYPKGSERQRFDGSSFIFREDNYEIENYKLEPIEDLKYLRGIPILKT